MNIFFLDLDPQIAAQYHCDKHVIKMILECAQLLYCAHWVLTPDTLPDDAYRMTHKNHPCSIWTRESTTNYLWVCQLGLALCKEYKFRYGEHKEHKTQKHLEWLIKNIPFGRQSRFDSDSLSLTPIKLAMPDEFKTDDPVESYRKFYIGSKVDRGFVTYTRRERPPFLLPRKIRLVRRTGRTSLV